MLIAKGNKLFEIRKHIFSRLPHFYIVLARINNNQTRLIRQNDSRSEIDKVLEMRPAETAIDKSDRRKIFSKCRPHSDTGTAGEQDRFFGRRLLSVDLLESRDLFFPTSRPRVRLGVLSHRSGDKN